MEISARQPNNTIPATAMDQSLRSYSFEDTLDDLMSEFANDKKVNPNHKIVNALLDDIKTICELNNNTQGLNDNVMNQLYQRLQSLIQELKTHVCKTSISTALNALNMLKEPTTSIQNFKQILTSLQAE